MGRNGSYCFLVYACHCATVILTVAAAAGAADSKAAAPREEAWGPVAVGLQVSAQVDREVFTACTPVFLRIAIRNASREPVPILVTGPEPHYAISVHDERGKAVPLTAYGKARQHAGVFLRTFSTTLKPGQVVRETVLLNRIHDMTESGTYTVRATRRFMQRKPAPGEKAAPESNAVQVKIAGAPSDKSRRR